MNNFMGKIVLMGLVFGVLASAVSMLLGFMVYYVISSIELFLTAHFLTYAAWISLGIGLLCTFGWYTYILLLARRYFIWIMEDFLAKFKKEK